MVGRRSYPKEELGQTIKREGAGIYNEEEGKGTKKAE